MMMMPLVMMTGMTWIMTDSVNSESNDVSKKKDDSEAGWRDVMPSSRSAVGQMAFWMTITIDPGMMMTDMMTLVTLRMTDGVYEMKSKGSCSLKRMRSYSSSRSAEGQMVAAGWAQLLLLMLLHFQMHIMHCTLCALCIAHCTPNAMCNAHCTLYIVLGNPKRTSHSA